MTTTNKQAGFKALAPDGAPSDVLTLFSQLWHIDGGGVLSTRGAAIYKQIKARGFWVSNTCGEVVLRELTNEQKRRIETRRATPAYIGQVHSMAFDRG